MHTRASSRGRQRAARTYGLAALLRAQARADLGLVSEAITDARLAAAALRNGYGEAHPDVDAAQALLASLQGQQGAAAAPAENQ